MNKTLIARTAARAQWARPHPLPSTARGGRGVILARSATAAFNKSGGFTLIEMVMVIALIGIVMSVVGSYAVQRFNQGKYNAGKAAVHSLDMKIQAYMLDNGSAPASLNDLVSRPGNAANWNGPYAKPGDINDPFNHPFGYKVPGDHGDYDVIFFGKDGQPGGDGMNKDYGNWE